MTNPQDTEKLTYYSRAKHEGVMNAMKGHKRYVVLEIDDESNTRAVWGPFETDEEASDWEGVPGSDPSTSYHVHPLYEAPQWGADDE